MAKPIPNAVSFRQLEQWRQRAATTNPEQAGSESAGGEIAGSNLRASNQASQAQPSPKLEQLLAQYERLGQELIQELGRQAESLPQQRSGSQLMALGALAAHVRLGLQALAASRR